MMCHGTSAKSMNRPLTCDHFALLMRIPAEMGFESIGYDQLEAWRAGDSKLPQRPVMFDFDHAVPSIRDEVLPILAEHGFKGNLFIDTGRPAHDKSAMSWDKIHEIVDAGWGIGAHTVTHPNLSDLNKEDPTGEKIRRELQQCDVTIHEHLGVCPSKALNKKSFPVLFFVCLQSPRKCNQQ